MSSISVRLRQATVFHTTGGAFVGVAVLLFVFFGLVESVYASTYVGPTGITYTEGINSDGKEDVQMTGGTSHSIWCRQNGVIVGAISYTGSSWVQKNCIGVNADIADGAYSFTDNNVTDDKVDGYFDIVGGVIIPPNDVTRIIELTPGGGSTTSTSSLQTFTVEGYINPDDFEASTTIEFSVTRDSSSQSLFMLAEIDSIGSLYGFKVTFVATTSGPFTYSYATDTSAYLEGVYSIVGQINIATTTTVTNFLSQAWTTLTTALEIANGSLTDTTTSNVVRKTDTFIIGNKTYYDTARDQIVEERNNVMADGSVCSPLSGNFEIVGCISFLIIPTPAMMSQVWTDLYNGVLTRFPFGYITRLMSIMQYATPIEPPAIVYTYGSSAPAVLQGKTTTFQVFDHFDLIPTIKADDGSNKNIWDIVMPYWVNIVGLAVLLVILNDLLGIAMYSAGRASNKIQKKNLYEQQRENLGKKKEVKK